MSLELRLVERDVLDADGEFVAADLRDTVDHQEWIAMRQRLQDLRDCHRLNGFRLVHRASPPSGGSLWPRAAIRSSHFSSRNQAFSGLAGVVRPPPARGPGGGAFGGPPSSG